MHSWIFRHLLELEAIYARRAPQRPQSGRPPQSEDMLPIHVLIPLPRASAPDRAA